MSKQPLTQEELIEYRRLDKMTKAERQNCNRQELYLELKFRLMLNLGKKH